MKNRIWFIFAMATISVSSHLAVGDLILSSDFNGVVKSGGAPYTATGITWDTVAGIDTPAGTLTFTDPAGGDVTGFHNVNANEIDVKYNLVTDGSWITSVSFTLNASTASIDLTSLDFNWRVTSNTGSNNSPTSKSDTWTAGITGSTSLSLGTASIGPQAPGSPTQFRSIDLSGFTLTNTETWTLSLQVDGSGFGHNASLQDIALIGTIHAIPEPATTSLLAMGSLTLLLLLRRTCGGSTQHCA